MPWEDLEDEIAEMFGDFEGTDFAAPAPDGQHFSVRASGELQAAHQRAYYARNREAEVARSMAKEKRRLAEDEEFRARRNRTKAESKRRRREMTKILKGDDAKKAAPLATGKQAPLERRPPEVVHVAGRLSDDPICGADPKGAYVVDQERASRASCEKCAQLRGGEGIIRRGEAPLTPEAQAYLDLEAAVAEFTRKTGVHVALSYGQVPKVVLP